MGGRGGGLMGIAFDPIGCAEVGRDTSTGPIGLLCVIGAKAVLYPALKAASSS